MPFTGQASRLRAAVESLRAWGTTRLHDALVFTFGSFDAGSDRRRSVVVLSDGADVDSDLGPDAVREAGCEPVEMEPLPDDLERVRDAVGRALGLADVVLLSGGTSKGAGDVNVRALEGFDPGVLVHGVALKPVP